jgi:hypothetical protein
MRGRLVAPGLYFGGDTAKAFALGGSQGARARARKASHDVPAHDLHSFDCESIWLAARMPRSYSASSADAAVPSSVRERSRELWSLALGDYSGIAEEVKTIARSLLLGQLAFSFRGCVSFWIAGEIDDRDLLTEFQTGACASLLGFAEPRRRAYLLELLSAMSIRTHVGRARAGSGSSG